MRKLYASFGILLSAGLLSCSSDHPADVPKDTVVMQDNTPSVHFEQPRSANVIIEDKAGNIWFTSQNNGVYRFDGNTFTHYTTAEGLGNNYTYCLMEDQSGKIWCGTADGLSYFNGTRFVNVSPAVIRNDNSYIKTTLDQYGVPEPRENGIWCILQDRGGEYWLGTHVGIFRYDGKSYTHFTITDSVKNNTKYHIQWTESILQDKDGAIWFGGRGDTGVFRFANGVLTNLQPDGDQWMRPLMQDRSGVIWIGSRLKFLFTYDSRQSDSTFTYFNHTEVDDWIFSMTEDQPGHFWFGKRLYDGRAIRAMTTKDGFCFDGEASVFTASDGVVWFTDQKHVLCRYDGKEFNSFTADDIQ